MFLYVAFQAVHELLTVPDVYENKFSDIEHPKRRIYAGMVSVLDEAVKNISQHLKDKGMWDDTLFIFSTDNGGQPTRQGNNWPLRGGKASYWEGGIKDVGFVHGQMLDVPNPNTKVNNQLIHISDWYPTLLHASSCTTMNGTQDLDGVDQWNTITEDTPSLRTKLLHNIDHMNKYGATEIVEGFDISMKAALRKGDWKLMTGHHKMKECVQPPKATNLRKISLPDTGNKRILLFNLKDDPSETNEVSDQHPDIVKDMLSELAEYQATAEKVHFPSTVNAHSVNIVHDDAVWPWE